MVFPPDLFFDFKTNFLKSAINSFVSDDNDDAFDEFDVEVEVEEGDDCLSRNCFCIALLNLVSDESLDLIVDNVVEVDAGDEDEAVVDENDELADFTDNAFARYL